MKIARSWVIATLAATSYDVVANAELFVIEHAFGAMSEDLIENDGLYLIRLGTENKAGQGVVAAVPACHLRLSSFREEIMLHAEDDGTLVGLDYKSPVGPLASTRDCTKMQVPESTQVITNIKVVRAANAQSVPLQVVTPNPPPGLMHLKDEGKDPKPGGSQSILIKYWYIFLPLAISWLFSAGGAAEPAAPGGQAAGGGGQGRAP